MEYEGEAVEVAFSGLKFGCPVDEQLQWFDIKVPDPDCLPCYSYPGV